MAFTRVPSLRIKSNLKGEGREEQEGKEREREEEKGGREGQKLFFRCYE